MNFAKPEATEAGPVSTEIDDDGSISETAEEGSDESLSLLLLLEQAFPGPCLPPSEEGGLRIVSSGAMRMFF